MIAYHLHDDLHCPLIVCDACHRQIVGPGNVYWLALDNGELHPGLWHTHKHPCSELDRAIERQHGGMVMFEELDVWLRQLVYNVRFPLGTEVPEA